MNVEGRRTTLTTTERGRFMPQLPGLVYAFLIALVAVLTYAVFFQH